MSDCFWTGFVGCEEIGCGGAAPPLEDTYFLRIELSNSFVPASVNIYPGEGFSLQVSSTPGEVPDRSTCSGGVSGFLDLVPLGYDEVSVDGITWLEVNSTDAVSVPIEAFTSGDGCDPGISYLRNTAEMTIRYRSTGDFAPPLEVPLFVVFAYIEEG